MGRKNNYLDVRNKIKTGDVYFTSSSNFLSKVVQIFTRSKISHCGIFLWLGKRLFTIEANIGHEIKLRLASKHLGKKKFYLRRYKKKISNQNLITFCLEDLGKKYDLIGAILSPITKIKNDNYFCSEFVAEKLTINLSKLKRGILPIDLYNFGRQVK
jgi:hypothetical protein